VFFDDVLRPPRSLSVSVLIAAMSALRAESEDQPLLRSALR
jgi:hypothetical protein